MLTLEHPSVNHCHIRASGPSKDATYDAFAAEHGRVHASDAEYVHRLGVFRSNVQLIEAHNARPVKSHTLAANRFTDWTEVRSLHAVGCARRPG